MKPPKRTANLCRILRRLSVLLVWPFVSSVASAQTITPAAPAVRNQVTFTHSSNPGLATNRVNVTDGSANSPNILINQNQPAVFYRLMYP